MRLEDEEERLVRLPGMRPLDEGLESARLDNLAAVVRRRVGELHEGTGGVRAGRAAVALQRRDVRRDAASGLGVD